MNIDIQTLIAGSIVFLAALYAGFLLHRKIRNLSPRNSSSCPNDCGCEGKAKKKLSIK